MKLKLLFSAIALIPVLVFGQENVTIDKNSFRKDKEGFSTAWKHIKQGDSFYLKGGALYAKAAEEYKRALLYNSENAELNYKTGVSCLFSDRRDEAITYLRKAYDLNNDVAGDVALLTGFALKFSSRFEEATDALTGFLNTEEKKRKSDVEAATRAIEQCKAAMQILKDTLPVEIDNMGANINSEADDYSVVLSYDGKRLYYASRKQISPKQKSKFRDKKFDENIFHSDLISGAWSVAVAEGKNINTEYCETPLFVDKTGDILFIYAGYSGEGDILVSEQKKSEWKKPVNESYKISTSYPETSFAISPTGDEIAFVSNRGKKGTGGSDVWFITRKGGRRWTKPFNPGDSINSSLNEESVKYSAGGDTVWFASAGHNSMGGFDIFYSTRKSDGSWGKARNVGFPVNTQWDELFYTPVPGTADRFMFVSNRAGGLGGLDIYRGKHLPPPPPPAPVAVPVQPKIQPQPAPDTIPARDTVAVIPPPPPVVAVQKDTVMVRDTVVVIKEVVKEVQPPVIPVPVKPAEITVYIAGRITDAETNEPVVAKLEVIELSSDSVVANVTSSDDGSYRIKLVAGKTYMMDIRASGFLSEMKRISTRDNTSEELITINAGLTKVKVGKKMVLNNIFFELGKAVLTPSSYSELDKLVKVLADNPAMKIEISGHTDNTGNPVINARLSTERARAVVEYLIRKGIDRTRLTYKGYGSEQPVAGNDTADGRAQNRRVEFKILGL